MKYLPLDLTVTAGTQVVIIVSDDAPANGEAIELKWELTPAMWAKFQAALGTEKVLIQPGVNGAQIPLLTRLGNIFYADRLVLGYIYRCSYGNNGLPSAVAHYINFNTPSRVNGYNQANVAPTVPTSVAPASSTTTTATS